MYLLKNGMVENTVSRHIKQIVDSTSFDFHGQKTDRKAQMIRNLKSMLSRSPSYLIYWVTQGCNFTCDHCFNHEENKKENQDLTLSEIEILAGNLKGLNYLTIAGGEPFLRKDLPEVVRLFHRQSGVPIINLITNGWFIEKTIELVKSILEDCPQLSLNLTVSIDGFEATHDSLRQKPGSFSRCVALLKDLKSIERSSNGGQLSVAAAGTYNATNAGELLSLATWIHENVEVPYVVGLVRGDVQNPATRKVDLSHYKKTMESIHALNAHAALNARSPRRLRTAVSQTVTDVILASAVEGKCLTTCRAGEKGFVLTANGDVLLCEVLGTRLGNLRQHEMNPIEILRAAASREAVTELKKNKCHCTWECFQTMNTALSPSLYPKIIGHYLRQPTKNVPLQHTVNPAETPPLA